MAALGEATFVETFGHLYPPEDLRAFLIESHSLQAWSAKLTDPQMAVWYAAASDSTPIGFVAVGACKLPIDNPEPDAGEIQQLYVRAHSQNLRLGTRLIALGVEWLEAQHRTPLYVGVWSQNFGAQRFYRRFGFNKVGEYGFAVGKTIDREFILKR